MRLRQRNLRGFVGPASCTIALGLMGLTLLCPTATFAFEVNQGISFSVDNTTSNSGKIIDTSQSHEIQFSVNEAPGAGNEDVTASGESEVSFDVENSAKPYTETGTYEVSVNIEEFLSIAMPDGQSNMDVAMEVDPTDQGTTQIGSTDFKVAGNNASGFGVYVNATSTSLTSESATNSSRINTIANTGTAVEDFTGNTWGYNVLPKSTPSASVNSYNPISTTKEEVWHSSTPTNWVELKLNCATKVNTQIPADTYSTDVVISAVAPFDSVAQP